jgi:hypothetical protein
MRKNLTLLGRMQLADCRLGKKHTAETKAWIGAVGKGRKHTEEAKAKMRAARARREANKPRTEEALLEQCRARQVAKYNEWAKNVNRRRVIDLDRCVKAGRMDLFADVRQSDGLRARRRLFDDSVCSDGFDSFRGKQYPDSNYGRAPTSGTP